MFKRGESYIIFENDIKKVFPVFLKLLSTEKKGMVIWRVHPCKQSEFFINGRVKAKWITNINTKEDHLSPHDLEQLSYDVEQFMKQNHDSTILLLGVEYLISFNSFQDILHLIQTIKDFTSEYGCIFIVHVSIGTLDHQQERLLLQELVFAGDNNG